MQYANDIAPTTLASSAQLREIISPLGACFHTDFERALAHAELESRIPGNSLAELRSESDALTEQVSDLETEVEETESDLDDEITEHKKSKERLAEAIDMLKEAGIDCTDLES